MDWLAQLGLLALAAVLTGWGSVRVETSAGRLADRAGLGPLVRGSLVVAVASSFPELTATMAAAAVHGDAELGLSAVIGSAIFNVLVIPGASVLAAGPLPLRRTLVYRDGQFYLIAVAVLLLTFCFAVLYAPVEGAPLTGRVGRPLAMLPLAFYGLYLFLQYEDRGDGGPAPEARTPDGGTLGDVLRLGAGLVAIVAGVEGLLRVALFLGEALDTPTLLWGGTVVAGVTSAPDLVMSVRAARRSEADVSIGNVLGSNVFDLLVVVPSAVLVAGSMDVALGTAVPLMAALTIATVALFAALRTDLRFSRPEAGLMVALYGAFVVWLTLEGFGLTQVLR
ncbi:MAG: sodium:calcium antiporter [Myxococcota bacterium]